MKPRLYIYIAIWIFEGRLLAKSTSAYFNPLRPDSLVPKVIIPTIGEKVSSDEKFQIFKEFK